MSRPLGARLAAVLRRVIYLPLVLALSALRFKVLRLTHPERVGHLAGELDAVLKERALRRGPARRIILLLPRDKVANRRLADYWAREVPTVLHPALCRIAEPLLHFGLTRFPGDITRYLVAIGETGTSMGIQREWGSRPPLLRLFPEDVERGERALRQLGLPYGAKFVCIHSRGGGYSPADEHMHNFRNSSIVSYLAAARALKEQGVFCVRMGDPSMDPVDNVDGVFDYAHSDLRSDWMDIFLCARCEFFLGNTSGLCFVATAFGVPCALANLVPLATVLGTGSPRDLGIPKLIRLVREGRYLRFAEAFGSPVADYRFGELYTRHGLTPIENDAEDIRALALEMLERIKGTAVYTSSDELLQARFGALMRPGHYSYGSAARVGRDFLRKYEHLLE